MTSRGWTMRGADAMGGRVREKKKRAAHRRSQKLTEATMPIENP